MEPSGLTRTHIASLPLSSRLVSFHIHHPVYPQFLRDDLVQRTFRDCLRVVRASTVPDASYVVSGDDLDEAAGLYVADFNKLVVGEEDVGWMSRDPFCCGFSLDCAHMTTWASVFVDIQPELCESCQFIPLQRPPAKTHHRNRAGTRLCSTRAYHGPTRLTPPCKPLRPRVFLLRDSNTLIKASYFHTKRQLTLRDP